MSARIEQPGPVERPILFSGEMVRAILEGRKTQTRRAVKPMPGGQSQWLTRSLIDRVPHGEIINGGWQMHHPLAGQTQDGVPVAHNSPLGWIRSPYGQPGDRLWVRETWASTEQSGVHPSDAEFVYRATDPAWGEEFEGWKWTPSIHMPRRASRLSLVVTGVRVERLQDISEGDAEAEGAEPKEYDTGRVTAVPVCCGRALPSGECCGDPDPHPEPVIDQSYRLGFEHLWDSINGKRPGCSWASNPWVWVVEFRRVA